jgi:hypothetical protein
VRKKDGNPKDKKRPKFLKLDEKMRKVFTILATKLGKIPD